MRRRRCQHPNASLKSLKFQREEKHNVALFSNGKQAEESSAESSAESRDQHCYSCAFINTSVHCWAEQVHGCAIHSAEQGTVGNVVPLLFYPFQHTSTSR